MSFSEADRPRKAARYNFSTQFELPSWGSTRCHGRTCMLEGTVRTSEPPPPPPPPPPPSPTLVFCVRYPNHGKEEAAPPATPGPATEGTACTSEPPPPLLKRFVRRFHNPGHGKEVAAPPASPLAPAPEEHRNLTDTPDIKKEAKLGGNSAAFPEGQRNLRRKRSARPEVGDRKEVAGPRSAPLPPVPVPYNSMYLRSRGNVKASGFSMALTRGEIEEDLYAFTGSKPPRYPKRRPKVIQEKLDAIFPGLSLPGNTALDRCRSLMGSN